MNILSLFLYAVAVVSQFTLSASLTQKSNFSYFGDSEHSRKGQLPYKELSKSDNNIPVCGGIENTTTGGIVHKPFWAVRNNERCVWILSVPGAYKYQVNILQMGNTTNRPDSGQGLIVSGFHAADETYLGMVTHEPIITENITIFSRVIAVTFFTTSVEANLSTGFMLQYEALRFDSRLKQNPLFISTGTCNFKYSPSDGNYSNNEMTAFVFLPTTGFYTGEALDIVYLRDALQNVTCLDAIHVYTFNATQPSTDTKWRRYRTYCGGVHNGWFDVFDMAIFIFQTSESIVGRGFWLSYLEKDSICE